MVKRAVKSFFELQRAQTLKERRKKVNVSLFTPKEKSISGKVCEFLIWASLKYPKYIILHEEITQAIFVLGKIPPKASKHVKSVAGSLSRARRLMKDKYKQDIIVRRGVGARATIDDLDIMTTSVMRDVDKHERTAKNLKETVNLVNNKKVDALIDEAPASIREDLRISRDYFNEYLTKYIKLLDKPINVKALLPPVTNIPTS